MTKRILILDADKNFTAELAQGLAKIDAFTVSAATTVREACLILSQEPQDVTFLPAAKDAGAVHTLRAFQPDLRLIITKPTSYYKVSEAYSGKIQGVLIKPLLDIDLATVLRHAMEQPVLVESLLSLTEQMSPVLDTAVIIAIFQKARLGKLVNTAILSQGSRLLSHWGELNETEAATVALQVGQGWETRSRTAQVRFTSLPPRAGELLLYTQSIISNYLLTFVAMPETPLRELRLRAQQLMTGLQDLITGSPPDDVEPVAINTGLLGQRPSYAIVWRPLRPLPAPLHIPLRRALERLAAANACVITHVTIRAELIHLVVLCPPGRDSAWAAYLFKNGSEATIQQEYGVHVSLWETGYYATESTAPLSEAELNLFLETDQPG